MHRLRLAAGRTRLLRLPKAPAVPDRAPRVLGVDEFAFRKGCTYGSERLRPGSARLIVRGQHALDPLPQPYRAFADLPPSPGRGEGDGGAGDDVEQLHDLAHGGQMRVRNRALGEEAQVERLLGPGGDPLRALPGRPAPQLCSPVRHERHCAGQQPPIATNAGPGHASSSRSTEAMVSSAPTMETEDTISHY